MSPGGTTGPAGHRKRKFRLVRPSRLCAFLVVNVVYQMCVFPFDAILLTVLCVLPCCVVEFVCFLTEIGLIISVVQLKPEKPPGPVPFDSPTVKRFEVLSYYIFLNVCAGAYVT